MHGAAVPGGPICIGGLCVVCNPPSGCLTHPPAHRLCTQPGLPGQSESSQSRTPTGPPSPTGPLLPGLPALLSTRPLPAPLAQRPALPGPCRLGTICRVCVFPTVLPPALEPQCHSGRRCFSSRCHHHWAHRQRSGGSVAPGHGVCSAEEGSLPGHHAPEHLMPPESVSRHQARVRCLLHTQEHCPPGPPGRPSLHRDSAANKWKMDGASTGAFPRRRAGACRDRTAAGRRGCPSAEPWPHRHSQEGTGAGRWGEKTLAE